MPLYRKFDPRLYDHAGFRVLDRTAREVTIYVLCGPQTNRIGLYTFHVDFCAQHLTLKATAVRRALDVVAAQFGWQYDGDEHVGTIYVPTWWYWNPPQSPSNVIGAAKDLHGVRRGPLLDAFVVNVEHLDPKLHEHFKSACASVLSGSRHRSRPSGVTSGVG